MKSLKSILLTVNTQTIYFYSFLTGIVTGLLAILFYKALLFCTNFNFQLLTKASMVLPGTELPPQAMIDGDPRRILYLVLPIIGGLLVGLITRFWAPEAAGTGTELFLDAFHNKAGVMRKRSPWAKALASLCTISTGGSAGKEGPTAQIGAGIGALFGRFVKMGARAQRTLLLAGTAGGLGAIFRAPLGGALTAIEVLYKEDFESDALIPCVISSVTAYTVFCAVIGFEHVFHFQSSPLHSPMELIFYIPLGFLCSGVGFLFVKIFHSVHDNFFEKLPIPRVFLPAVGGLLVGCVGFFHPEVIGEGLGLVQQALNGNFEADWVSACRLFAFFALLKIFTTTFTVQSGGSGGVFGPSLFIGGMLGGLVGTLGHQFFPELVPSVAPFIVVGMASFFAGVANAPIASLVIVSELTGGYELLPPLMVVSVIALIFSKNWSIYKNQVKNKFYSQAHLWDMNPGTLKGVTIKDAFNKQFHHESIINHSDSLEKMEAMGHQFHESDLIVQDDEKNLIGIISLRDFYYNRAEIEHIKHFAVAKDLIERPSIYVTPNDSLYQALQLLIDSDFDKVPVVEVVGERKVLLGYLQYQDILKFYKSTEGNTRLFQRRFKKE